ncbi:hypothetical protein [Nostoc sp.]|uniref:hypothetical protein n=1 Tax=Nostoc sp. TaxID=1180 RepID=UPI002FF24139
MLDETKAFTKYKEADRFTPSTPPTGAQMSPIEQTHRGKPPQPSPPTFYRSSAY